jgi:spore maturation protein CgeB
MRVVLFCHTLVSDWNHGNAHFLRGIVSDLLDRGHDVGVYEPADSWSRTQLIADAGESAVAQFHRAYPRLASSTFDVDALRLDHVLDDADLVLVHEWSAPALVAAIGRHRALHGGYVLLFHDTHHRSVTDAPAMAQYDLEHYDGVLAFGEVVRQRYLALGWARRAWTWHEAADIRVFTPRPGETMAGDLIWIGNWGDEERTAELREFLIEPVRDLALHATIYGVRYPATAQSQLAAAGIRYGGWLPNYQAPDAYARHRMTVHIPRRPYVTALPGIPTIRVFEALACGMPLVSMAWDDAEGLFTPGADFLVARTAAEMRSHLAALRGDDDLCRRLSEHGLATVRSRHTCAHRVDELLDIVAEIRGVEREVLTA